MKGTVRVGPLTEEEMILMAMVGHPDMTPWGCYTAVLTKWRQGMLSRSSYADHNALVQFCEWYTANEVKLEDVGHGG